MSQPSRRYLDGLIYGIKTILNAGIELLEYSAVNFEAPLVAADDAVNLRTNVTIDEASATSGGITPIVTASNKVLTTTAGLASAWGTVVNAMVDAAAAIAGTKIDPNFGAQDITTTGNMYLGSSPATIGDMNVPSGFVLAGIDAAGTGEVKLIEWTVANVINIGLNDTDLDGIILSVPTGKSVVLGADGQLELGVTDDTVRVYNALKIGTTVASTGDIQLKNACTIVGRDAANGGDAKILEWTSGDIIAIGDNDTDLEGVTLNVPTGKTVKVNVAGTQVLDVAGGPVLTLGATAATAGTMRVGSGFQIQGRDAANGGDANIIQWTSGDVVFIGANDTDLEGVSIAVPTGKSIALQAAGSTELSITDDAIAVNGTLTMAASKSLDCYTNGAYFKPRRISQASIPTPQTGELLIWHDSDALPGSELFIVYEDPTVGTKSAALT